MDLIWYIYIHGYFYVHTNLGVCGHGPQEILNYISSKTIVLGYF